MNSKKTIAIMFGGRSPEHEVSVITGLQVVENLDTEKYKALPIYISKDGKWYVGEALENVETYRNLATIPEKTKQVYLSPEPGHSTLKYSNTSAFSFGKNDLSKIDVVFPTFHGGQGENGVFQSLFEMTDIPYVCSSVIGSAVGFDKIHMKKLFEASDIPVAPYKWFYRNKWHKSASEVMDSLENKLKYPMFIKPANGGSSIGTTKAHDRKELQNAVDVAATFDRKIIVEEGIEDAREINISVMGNAGSTLECSVCEEVFPSSGDEALSYDDKYKGEGDSKSGSKGSGSEGMASTKRQIPAKIKDESREKIEKLAKKAFKSLDNAGLVRNDFLIKEETGEVYIIETNTIPGSMSYYLWEASGLMFKDMVTKLITLAEDRDKDMKKNVMTFQSNILESFKLGGTKGKAS